MVVSAAPAAAQPPSSPAFDWNVPERLAGDAEGDVLFNPFANPIAATEVYSAGGAFPDLFPVRFDACKEAAVGASFEWRVGDTVVPEDGCEVEYAFPAEGSYPVTLTVVRADGTRLLPATREVVVQDWLIVSLGDSVASGEGNPDIQADEAPSRRPSWRNAACHRSGRAGPARAARAIEQGDAQTSVTFIHLACSGATVTRGLLGKQGGHHPQIDRLVEVASRREVDAVLLSVGANDIGFAKIVKRCLYREPCGAGSARERELERDFEVLDTSYRSLADQLQAPIGLPPERVLVTDYFNPTRDDGGLPCGEEDVDASGRFLTTPEWIWAESQVLTRLNAAVARAARRHAWTPVTGFDGLADRAGFHDHGFCADEHWVIRLGESPARQGDLNGSVHPNELGHAEYGRRLAGRLTEELYPGPGMQPRRPLVLPNDPASPVAGLADRVLARRFLPRLLFDRSERWRPLDVEMFLRERAHYLCTADIKGGFGAAVRDALDLVLPRERRGCERVTRPADLGREAPRGSIRYLLVNGTDSVRSSQYEAPDLGCNESDETDLRELLRECNGGPSAAVYYTVTRRGVIAYIDYWWFLRYNETDGGPVFDHQADWEGAVVAVDTRDPSTFLWAAVAAHEGEPWRYPRALLRCDGALTGSCGSEDRPSGRRMSIFVADGSHAGYTSPCSRHHLGSCGQNERPPERGFDGFMGWTANDEPGVLKPLHGTSWHDWPGWWNVPRFKDPELPGHVRGSRVRSPAAQTRFSRPWRHRPTECRRAWCQEPLELARQHARSCGSQPPRAISARVCLAVPTGGGPIVRARPASVQIQRFSAPGRTRPVSSARGPLPGASALNLEGSAFVGGERIEITGVLRPGTVVIARGAGSGESHEAVFVMEEVLGAGELVELTANDHGQPAARLRGSGGGRGDELDAALEVRIY